jgi:hypothetical protein
LYYRDSGVTVTDQWFTVGRQRFPVTELQNVVVTRQRTTPVLATAIAASVVFLVAFLVGLGSGRVWTLFVVVAAGGLAIGIWWAVRRPTRYEVWASYRGMEVVLFSSADSTQLSRVTRALKRALEARIYEF